MSDDDNLIPVDFTAPRETETTLRIVRKRRPSWSRIVIGGKDAICEHAEVLIDEDTLDLECATCGVAIDARLFVMEWAQRMRRLAWNQEAMAKLREERETLHREIKNLKAQRRRLTKAGS